MSDFDYQSLYTYIPVKKWRYTPFDECDDYSMAFIGRQYDDDDGAEIWSSFYPPHTKPRRSKKLLALTKERNLFLERVCSMIGVEPTEAIAKKFTSYLPMIEWMRKKYHTHVVKLFEDKIETHYQAMCEAIYARIDPEEYRPIAIKRAIGVSLQRYLRRVIKYGSWWNKEVSWIFSLSTDSSNPGYFLLLPEDPRRSEIPNDIVEACDNSCLYDDDTDYDIFFLQNDYSDLMGGYDSDYSDDDDDYLSVLSEDEDFYFPE